MKKEGTKIYLDESGNTGQDLLNKDQKVFVLATHNFSNTELNTLSTLFENSGEIHFMKLRKSERGRGEIINFLNHPLITSDNILCSIAHKELSTVGHIVDRLIEPIFYENNIDIYQYGKNIAITNFLFYFGNFFWDKQLYSELLISFIKMIRIKDNSSIEDFYLNVNSLLLSDKTEQKELLFPLIESKKIVNNILNNIDKFSLDLTVSSFYIICDLWYRKTEEKLSIIQDDSKQMEHFKEFIELTRTLAIPNQEIGFGNRKMIFPTQIEKLELVNSESSLGVQIADLIGSSITFMYNNVNIKQEPFVKQIQNSKLLSLDNYHTIWPRSDVSSIELGMNVIGGENVLDFLARNLK